MTMVPLGESVMIHGKLLAETYLVLATHLFTHVQGS